MVIDRGSIGYRVITSSRWDRHQDTDNHPAMLRCGDMVQPQPLVSHNTGSPVRWQGGCSHGMMSHTHISSRAGQSAQSRA